MLRVSTGHMRQILYQLGLLGTRCPSDVWLPVPAWFLKALLLSVRSPPPSRLANEVSGLAFPPTYLFHLGIPGYWAIISRGPNEPIKANDKAPN